MKIGNEILSKKTTGLSAKDHDEFERFKEQRKKKTQQKEKEEKITAKMPNDEGDATDTEIAKQREDLAKEKHAYDELNNIKNKQQTQRNANW
ncbi:MAG: hypothetical protein NWE96_04320 [Candidatus Bathyarchaeota archaeon]|nr:hypothetical protein [Candidatus Bathyarchaeota archaeon]